MRMLLPYPGRPLKPQVFTGTTHHHFTTTTLLNKLVGFDFAVEYRAGKQNKMANALSRRLEDQSNIASLSMPHLPLFYSNRTKI